MKTGQEVGEDRFKKMEKINLTTIATAFKKEKKGEDGARGR